MSSRITGIPPESAISAIIPAQIRQRKEDFAGIRDRSGFEALFGSSGGRKKVGQMGIAAGNKLYRGFARNGLARAKFVQSAACSGSEEGRRHVASNDTTLGHGNVGGCRKHGDRPGRPTFCCEISSPAVAAATMSLNAAEFRRAMGAFATGVTIITLDLDGEVHGMTANAFASVSLDPLLVLVCVDHSTRTHAHMHAKKRFGINVLCEDQKAISEYYARPERTHENAEAEAGARFDRTGHGTPMLHGALAYLECRLRSAEVAGDHTVFIAEVEDLVVRDGDPLLYFRGKYRKVGEQVAD